MSRSGGGAFGGPLPDSYWAEPGRFLAGPHPLGGERAAERAAIRALIDAGVRTVIDLRTPMEGPSARSLLDKVAGPDEDCTWVGVPLLDGSAPSEATLVTILDLVDASIARERPVYLHCRGGLGRTGVVVACWWIRHGRFDAAGALVELTRRRVGQPHGAHRSPETAPQYRLVERWRLGR